MQGGLHWCPTMFKHCMLCAHLTRTTLYLPIKMPGDRLNLDLLTSTSDSLATVDHGDLDKPREYYICNKLIDEGQVF